MCNLPDDFQTQILELDPAKLYIIKMLNVSGEVIDEFLRILRDCDDAPECIITNRDITLDEIKEADLLG